MTLDEKYHDLFGENWSEDALKQCINDPEITRDIVYTESGGKAFEHLLFKNIGRKPKQFTWTFSGGGKVPRSYQIHLPPKYTRAIRTQPNPPNGCLTQSKNEWSEGNENPSIRFVERILPVRGNNYTYTVYALHNPTPDLVSCYLRIEETDNNGRISQTSTHDVIRAGKTWDIGVGVTGQHKVLDKMAFVQKDSYYLE